MDADNGIAMEGYLFKRASNAFKTWNRSDIHSSISIFMNTLKILFYDKERTDGLLFTVGGRALSSKCRRELM